MPAILVASKMKSGLPKPVHSASPIVHIPAARTIPQPCYLKFGNKVEVNKSSYASQIPFKSQNGHENAGDGFLRKKSSSIENGFDTQVSKMVLAWGEHGWRGCIICSAVRRVCMVTENAGGNVRTCPAEEQESACCQPSMVSCPAFSMLADK
ncbi:hypothetical protein E2320_021069, partial [Naja naja]